MKFTLDVTLATRIDTTRGEGTDSEFAQAVLAFDGVASVFGVNDFVTITREPDADWDPIVCAVEAAAAEYLEASSGAAGGRRGRGGPQAPAQRGRPAQAPPGRDRPATGPRSRIVRREPRIRDGCVPIRLRLVSPDAKRPAEP